MGRGINLGNTLEPPFEGSWNNGPAQESYFDAYEEAGFANIRIPVRWDEHTANAAPFAIEASWMDRVEEVVDWGLSRGFYITLNGHHEDWLKNNYSNPTLRARYDSIWVQVAERFQNKSDKLLFEIINEPNGMSVSQVDDLNQRILGIIRQTNPTRIVIYGGNMYANAEQLLNAAIPEDDYIIGYYHSYDPWQFSGQGMGTWGTANDYQQLNNKYQNVKDWSVANNIPIHHSEFGAIHACDYNSRMRIYAHNVERCIVHGFAFSVWDDGGNFGILNRGPNTWPEVKDILMHYHEDSPNQVFSTFETDETTEEPLVSVEWNNRISTNGSIFLERSTGNSDNFVQIAELPSDAESYTDTEVSAGNLYTYRMYTHRADGTLLHAYPTRVAVTSGVQSPYNEEPIQIPGVLEVEEYDNGGQGLSYFDTDATNIPGAFRPAEGVDIGTHDGGFILEYVAQGEWIEYTVEVNQGGVYTVSAEVASEQANGTFNIEFEQSNTTTDFTVPSTGNWYIFTEISAGDAITLEAGVQRMRLNITNNTPFNVDRLMFNLLSVNVEEQAAQMPDFKISPNPTKGIINIELSDALGLTSDLTLSLFEPTGKKLREFQMNESISSLDISDLAKGVYILRLAGDNMSADRKIIRF